MRLHFSGVEALTVELDGAIPEARARAIAGRHFSLELRGGQVPVSLLVFRMHRLAPVELPGPALDYDEALWRIGIVHEGAPAWLAHACDLDKRRMRILGRWLVRYPGRAARFSMERDGAEMRVRVEAAGAALSLRAEAIAGRCAAVVPPEPPRRVLVRDGQARYEIPWYEEPAPDRDEAEITILGDTLSEATFGTPVAWSRRGLLHRGRIHRCGLASQVAGGG
jgi:uncharacterized protein YqjF (DUF2071 family)